MDNNEFLSGGQKTPSVSWRNKPVGTTVSGKVAREPRTMQSLDYDDSTPEFWDPPMNTRPKMQMAIYLDLGTVHPDTETYPDHDGVWAVYVRQSTQFHKELKEAIRKSGAKGIDVGGHLTVTYIGDGEQKNPKFNPPKLYRVEYRAPATKATSDFLDWGKVGTTTTTMNTSQAPAGLDPAAWASLDEPRKASILAQMSAPAGAGVEPPF